MKNKIYTFLFFTVIFTVLVASFIYIKESRLIIDEYFHYEQITTFLRGEWYLNGGLSMLPGFHLVMAAILKILDAKSVVSARFVSLTINFISVVIFFLLAKKMDKGASYFKTAEYVFCPIIFSFFSLMYADIFSILIILAAFYFVITKKYRLAGFTGSISILAKQNNIIWLIFLHVFAYLQEYGLKLSFPLIKKFIKRTWIFFSGYLFILVFIIVNGGIATSGKYWQRPVFNPSNVYFFLFLVFWLLLPIHLANFSKVKRLFSYRSIQIVSFLFFLFFIFTFANTHPWNQYRYFLRNNLLIVFTGNIFVKTLFFLPMLYSLLSLFYIRLLKNKYYLIYPFILLSILPVWLIEQRYYMLLLTFLLLFRKKEEATIEYIFIFYSVICSLILFEGIAAWRYFL